MKRLGWSSVSLVTHMIWCHAPEPYWAHWRRRVRVLSCTVGSVTMPVHSCCISASTSTFCSLRPPISMITGLPLYPTPSSRATARLPSASSSREWK